MLLPRFEHLRPASLKECLAILEESGEEAKVLAGGTGLLPNMKYGVTCPKKVVSIRSIPELCSVSEDKDGSVRVGSCVTLSDLAKNPIISERFPALHEAVKSVGSRHIRNMASIGGNICLETRCWYYNQSKQWRHAIESCHRTGGSVCHAIRGSKRCYAINSSDTAPALIALDAQVSVMKKDQERWVPIRDFFRDDGYRHTELGAGEVVTSVRIPNHAGLLSAIFMKIQFRKGLDFAIGSIGASVKGNGRTKEIALVVNSIASAPLILKKAAQTIMESGFGEEAIARAAETARSEIGTVTNLFTSAGYKRQIVEVLVKRTLSRFKEEIRS